jgi:hypothetical protein
VEPLLWLAEGSRHFGALERCDSDAIPQCLAEVGESSVRTCPVIEHCEPHDKKDQIREVPEVAYSIAAETPINEFPTEPTLWKPILSTLHLHLAVMEISGSDMITSILVLLFQGLIRLSQIATGCP